MERMSLWNKNFIIGAFMNFLLLLNYNLLMIIMADFAMSRYHVSSSSAGLSASMFIIGALIARLFSAGLMARLGEKKLLLLGTSLGILSSCAYFMASNIVLLFVIRLAHGISYGMASTAISTIVTSLIPEKHHGEGVGYFMLSITLGSAIGPFLGMFLNSHGGFSSIFATCIFTAALCFLGALLLPSSGSKLQTASVQKTAVSQHKSGFGQLFEKKALPISLICAGIFFCYSGIISFLTSYARELHLETAASFFFIVYSGVILITRPFTGRMFDKKGEFSVMLPAFSSFFIGMLLLSRAHTGFLLLTAAGFLGFGLGIIQPCGLALALKEAPAERIRYVNSTFYIFLDIGTGIGPFLLGFLVPAAGYRGMYLCLSVFILLLTFLYFIVRRHHRYL